jgi:hypothetical protein
MDYRAQRRRQWVGTNDRGHNRAMPSSPLSIVWPAGCVVLGVVLQLALGGSWGFVLIVGGVVLVARQRWRSTRQP